jgi:triphosphoribosyl-dephospho-CoA synthase
MNDDPGMKPERVAQCAVLAMLLELSSSPKPGNVDRCHDFSDIGFHHFQTSAVSAYPIFYKAAQGRGSAGSLILEGVEAWRTWNLKSNTHFGSLVLMIPIAIATGRRGEPHRGLPAELAHVLEKSTIDDAIDFYRAFELAGARVTEVDSFSLKDRGWEKALRESGKTLLELMRLSAGHDLVAREWSTNYRRSFSLAERLVEQTGRWGGNDGVVRVFLEALAEVPDSLISAKFGTEVAREVSSQAGLALLDLTLGRAQELDRDLLARDINPGSTADLIAASLFISLLRGLRF